MKTILLIEDDSFLIDIYTAKFKEVGFEVRVAKNGKEGIEKLKEKIPDVLLVDIVLPKIDGWKVLEEIQKMKKEKFSKDLEKMKIVILSNLGQKEDIEKGIKLGAIKYLIKAYFTPTQVVEEIKRLF